MRHLHHDSRTTLDATNTSRPRRGAARLLALGALAAGCAVQADEPGYETTPQSVSGGAICPSPCTATGDGGLALSVSSLAIATADPEVALGADAQFTATGRTLLGSQDITGRVVWSSSNPAVADFDRATATHVAVPGLLHTFAPGRTTIQATLGSGLSVLRAASVAVIFPRFGGGSRVFQGHVSALAADGRTGALYIGGDFLEYNGVRSTQIARILPNGDRDPAFAAGDLFNTSVHALALVPDAPGDVYVGGNFSTYRGGNVGSVVRLDARGQRVNSFACPFQNRVRAVLPTRDGTHMVYLGGEGTSSTSALFVRVDERCMVDPNFHVGAGFDGAVRAMAFAADGSGDLYVAGDFHTYQGAPHPQVVRVNSAGVAVTGGSVGAGFGASVFALAPTSAGSLYVGGVFASYDSVLLGNGVARLDGQGLRDVNFATGVGVGPSNSVNGLLAEPSGSGVVYLGGHFSTYNGASSPGLVRALANGARDPLFQVGAGFSNPGGATVEAVIYAPDTTGDLYVGGTFNQYNGMTANGLIRLSSRGVSR